MTAHPLEAEARHAAAHPTQGLLSWSPHDAPPHIILEQTGPHAASAHRSSNLIERWTLESDSHGGPSRPRIALAVAASLIAAPTGSVRPAAQPADPAVTRLALAGAAKRFCSGIWVSERDRNEALRGSVLQTKEAIAAYDRGDLRFVMDDGRRVVTAFQSDVSARARLVGDQGCVILPDGTDEVSSRLGRS